MAPAPVMRQLRSCDSTTSACSAPRRFSCSREPPLGADGRGQRGAWMCEPAAQVCITARYVKPERSEGPSGRGPRASAHNTGVMRTPAPGRSRAARSAAAGASGAERSAARPIPERAVRSARRAGPAPPPGPRALGAMMLVALAAGGRGDQTERAARTASGVVAVAGSSSAASAAKRRGAGALAREDSS